MREDHGGEKERENEQGGGVHRAWDLIGVGAGCGKSSERGCHYPTCNGLVDDLRFIEAGFRVLWRMVHVRSHCAFTAPRVSNVKREECKELRHVEVRSTTRNRSLGSTWQYGMTMSRLLGVGRVGRTAACMGVSLNLQLFNLDVRAPRSDAGYGDTRGAASQSRVRQLTLGDKCLIHAHTKFVYVGMHPSTQTSGISDPKTF